MFGDSDSESTSDLDEYDSDSGSEDIEFDDEKGADQICDMEATSSLCKDIISHKRNIYNLFFPNTDANTDETQDVNIISFYSALMHLIYLSSVDVINKQKLISVPDQLHALNIKYKNNNVDLLHKTLDEINKIHALLDLSSTQHPGNKMYLLHYITTQFLRSPYFLGEKFNN